MISQGGNDSSPENKPLRGSVVWDYFDDVGDGYPLQIKIPKYVLSKGGFNPYNPR